ncbi:MAG: YihY family inner membrane protein [Ideonella sp.]|nr:YihY family inner membrane protein [Ideonella sp.]
MPAPQHITPTQELTRTLHALQRWPWMATVRTLYQRFREDRLGVTASSLTFTTLISLVPLVTVGLAVFSAFPMFDQFQLALQKMLITSLVPDNISRQVLQGLTQFATQAKRLGAVGFAFLVLTALALMATIDRTLNTIWRVRRMRSFGRRVLIYWSAATLGPLVFGLGLSVTSLAVTSSRGVLGEGAGGVGLLLDAFGFTLLAAMLTGMYRFVPNTPVRWRHALAGGLFVAVAFEIAKNVLAWYLARVPTYSLVYGAFATVPILLIWIYTGWLIVLFGAVIAAYAPSLQMHMQPLADVPGARFRLAVALLRELVRAREKPARGASAEQLSRALRTDPLPVESLLEALIAIDWVGRLDEPGGARYVLLCDPAATSARPLLAQLLLDPANSLQGFWQRAGFDEMTLAEIIVAG